MADEYRIQFVSFSNIVSEMLGIFVILAHNIHVIETLEDLIKQAEELFEGQTDKILQ